MTRQELRVLAAAAVLIAVVVAASFLYLGAGRNTAPSTATPPGPPAPPTQPPVTPSGCKESRGAGFALCVERNVTRVIDGDTLEVAGPLRIRLVLVDAPEANAPGGANATQYLTTICSGQLARVDEDDFQVGADPYGRVLAVVYCATTNANAAMISSGYATTYFTYCSSSEFGNEAWTGCSAAPPPSGNCDPSYPDVCIPPPPPDLDCKDIPYRNFRVLPPDPHHFDGDHDGIGCEA